MPGSQPVDGAVIDRSAETLPSVEQAKSTPGVAGVGWGIINVALQATADLPEWGTLVQRRDIMLRQFLATEPFAAAAFASVVSRYATFSWTLNGAGPRTTARLQYMLNTANFGAGWGDFICELAMDYLTQDKGAFVELIRTADSPDSPVIGIRALNALQCWSTGNPEIPVMFRNEMDGQYIPLKWYQVHHIREIPMHSPIARAARAYRLQLCALSRAFLHVRAFRSTIEYLDEKTSGRHHKAIHVIAGVGKNEVDDALARQAAAADEKFLRRYIQPVVIAPLSPESKPAVATLELSTMPDGWDQQKLMTQYLTLLSMALLCDYQELAPLPGGNIGTGTQSAVLDKKSKAKGAGLFRKLITHMMNNVVLPEGCEFKFDEQDLDEDKAAAEAREIRAKGRALMKAIGEVDVLGARQMSLDDGDISPELFEAMGQRDLTEQAIRDDERQKTIRELIQTSGTPAGKPIDEAVPSAISPAGRLVAAPPGTTGAPGVGTVIKAEGDSSKAGAPGIKATREDVDDDIHAAEDEAAGMLDRQLAKVFRSLKDRLADLE